MEIFTINRSAFGRRHPIQECLRIMDDRDAFLRAEEHGIHLAGRSYASAAYAEAQANAIGFASIG